MKHLLLPVTLLLATAFIYSSCKKKTDKSVNNYSAYFGGTINQQEFPYVVFYNDDKIIDTLQVTADNSFGKRFDALMPGMYYYSKGDETGFVYFNKNDSVFLNYSIPNLTYKGTGGAHNTFLLELLDAIDANNEKFDFLYKKPYKQFKISVDSLRDQRRAFYLRKKTEISWNKEFDALVKNLIDYSYYTNLEIYALNHQNWFPKDSLPADYFGYKQKISFNNKQLLAFKPYVNYLTLVLNKNNFNNKTTISNELKALEAADSLFTDNSLKNKVTYELAKQYVLNYAADTYNSSYFALFSKINSNSYYTNKLDGLQEQISQFKKQTSLPKIDLITLNKDPFIEFKSNKEQLLFFWSASNLNLYQKQIEHIKNKINLNKTVVYAINVDDVEVWKTKIPQFDSNFIHLNATHLFDLKQKWAFTSLNRLIYLKPNGTIKKPFAKWTDFK